MKDHESRIAEAALGRRVIERQPEKAEMPVARERDPGSQVSCRIGDASCASAHATTLRRSTASQVSRARDSLLRLQRQYGNLFLQRVLAVARQSDEGGDVAPAIERAIHSKRGGGQALDGGVRGKMESAFGADFGGVRVHSDSESDALNRSLNARAFTTGSDIFFRQGAYSPGSSAGKELLAHELTHVVQQRGKEVRKKLTVGRPGDRFEQEADRVARAIMAREERVSPRKRDLVQRQPEEEKEEEEEVRTRQESPGVQTQPEEEEEEKEIQTKRDSAWVRRQESDEEEAS